MNQDDYRPYEGYRILIEEDLFDLQAAANDIARDVRAYCGWIVFLGGPILKKDAVFQALVISYF